MKPLKNQKKRPTEVSTPKIFGGNRRVSFKVSLKKEAKPDFFRGYKMIFGLPWPRNEVPPGHPVSFFSFFLEGGE
jgi:hypothetical protein